MASRLDKLFDLLESNNPSIRSAAAIQIGTLSTNSQVQIPSLLNKLLPYVKHKSWSVRIAAADAVKHIGSNSKLWVPNRANITDKKPQIFPEMISLEKLNLIEILKIGTRLYSTDFKDLDDVNADSSVCKEELSRHLGFMIPEEYEVKSMLNNDDFEVHKVKQEQKVSIESAVKPSLDSANRKCVKRSHSSSPDPLEPESKTKCLVKTETVTELDHTEWPWVDFCDVLLGYLWNAKWEIRHGAATALRELVRSQGSVMICKNGNNLSRSQFSDVHSRYQEEVVGRLLCTLALDQLSDFVSDEMVAPVRESCAQVLGVMSVHLAPTLVLALTRNLLSLLEHGEWTVNHGSLLGLKYLLAARPDLIDQLIDIVYDPISKHLKVNCDDDVRCAAAAALMPIFNKPDCVVLQPNQLITLEQDLFELLSMRHDYNSPGETIAVLQLLEKLFQRALNHNNSNHLETADSSLIPSCINRLHWCYYSYSDTVRLTAIRTCWTLARTLHTISATFVSNMLVQIFQRVLIDDNAQVVALADQFWCWLVNSVPVDILAQASLNRLDVWMCAAMQPARLSFGPGVIIMPTLDGSADSIAQVPNAVASDETAVTSDLDCKLQYPQEFFIGGRESFLSEGNSIVREEIVLQARTASCRLLAKLCNQLVNISEPLAEHILITILAKVHLTERLAMQRLVAAVILTHWYPQPNWVAQHAALLVPLRQALMKGLDEPIYYQELLPAFRHMIKACRDLHACYTNANIDLPPSVPSTGVLNLTQCQYLITNEMTSRLNGSAFETIISAARTSVDLCSNQHTSLTRLVDISLGRAMLQWGWVPDTLTPLIKPLMDAIRCDPIVSAQTEAANALGQLVIDFALLARLTGPIGKLVRNLVQYQSDAIDALASSVDSTGTEGDCAIIALGKIATYGRDTFPGQEEQLTSSSDPLTAPGANVIKLRGTRLALLQICHRLVNNDDHLNMITSPSVLVQLIYNQLINDTNQWNQPIILSLLRAATTCMPALKPHAIKLGLTLVPYALSIFQHGLGHRDRIIRHWSARLLAVLAMPTHDDDSLELCSQLIDEVVLSRALEALQSLNDDQLCLGCMELIYLIMHDRIGPLQYRLAIVASVLPVVLRCLSAHIDGVRRLATHTFSSLLSLLPLEQTGANLSILTPSRRDYRQANLHFIDGLLNPDSIPPFRAHEHIVSASLRHYQQQGLNWLAFLNRYGLHGVLADDMGLGKTLQTICIIAGQYDPPGASQVQQPPPSLVVCPSTLTSHWHNEVTKHVTGNLLSSVVYAGSVEARAALWPTLHRYQLVITSYDILRNDIDRLCRPPLPPCNDDDGTRSLLPWNYVVLDEGHLIRNHKSKLAAATKLLCAKHRLVLTGTPIQNRVAELWSLFDFLMPGLLGSTHTDFHKRYGRLLEHAGATANTSAIVSTRKPSTADTQAAATWALDQLHRQVLPFMLRRIKDDVLHELPPKIIQDYICAMTPLQARLYAHCLSAQRVANGCPDDDDEQALHDQVQAASSGSEQRKHIFQTLHYLRLVCNHPKLALRDGHPLHASIMAELEANSQSIDEASLSGKLVALKQLIIDCGVGGGASFDTMVASDEPVVSAHRLLVFCQTRAMLTLVHHMINSELPRASLLRLDGSVSVPQRQSIVDQFNRDASIDMLLLTTSIGGLGLNLTSADVVIFVEHDWNPMRDLQAMDRAHRIGQKRTVNVYRLITADSIEEKIMNLQKFKLFVANTVVSNENKQFSSTSTDSVLDTLDKHQLDLAKKPCGDDLFDDYTDEYSLDAFVQNL